MAKRHENPKPGSAGRLRIAALAALYVGCSTWTGLQADDSEIYVNKVPSAQTPNVLFGIDTSGSMGSDVQGGNQTRIEAVKDALTGLIQNNSNLKAGLGRFHYELGGPIVFPVVNLEETPDFLEDTTSISSIDRSSDDAEEAGGVVTLDDRALEMTELNTGGDTNIKLFELQADDSNDDDEDGDSGSYTITSPDLDIGDEDAGIRFRNVNIPKNAVILHAEIEFTARTDQSEDDTNVEIFGHDVDSSPVFVDDNSDIDNRLDNATDASVRWSNIIPLSAGQSVSTPNIRTIVKEIVDRDSWASGNDMTFLLEDEGGHRELSTVDDGGGSNAPILRIHYVNSATDVPYQVLDRLHDANETSGGNVITGFNGFYLFGDDAFGVDFSQAGMIFENVDIPAAADVLWADITWTTRNERTSPAQDMEIYGIADADPGGFSDGNSVSGRPVTASSVTWDALFSSGDEEIFAPDEPELMMSPNLEPLIEDIRTNTSYQPGNNIGFVFRDAAGSDINERHLCSFDGVEDDNGCPEDTSARPTLRLVYAFGATPSIQQQIGLRFNDVRVPQGASIESAHLEFTVDGATTEPGDLTIEIEDNTEPATYSNNAGETVSARTYGASTSWTTDIWDTTGETKQSPDLSSLVSSVTDQTDWCGGGSLAFRITGTTARQIAQAWDKGTSGAPTLRVEYNTDSLGATEGCTAKQTSVSITDEDNDVEEQTGDGEMVFNSGDLDLYNSFLSGLRFEDVHVPRGANITSANLRLTADDFDTGSNTVTIKAQQHPNAPAFTDSDGDLSSRDTGGLSETWTITDTWNENEIHTTSDDGTDLTALIQDIVDGTVTGDGEQWASGNALVFILESNATADSGDRQAEVCCRRGDPPARLDISYEILLGATGDSSQVTGREAILSIIDELVASGFTPPVDFLFEAGSYFSGEPVHYGRTRGAGKSYESSGPTTDTDLDFQIQGDSDSELLREGELSRLSHYATYTPAANIVRQGSCTGDNPNHGDCAAEHIDNNDSPDYVSPFEGAEPCERGFLVLLSDGIANRNSSRDLIQGLTGSGSCDLDIPQIDENTGEVLGDNDSFVTRDPSSDEMCGLELSQYLYETDFIPDGGGAEDVDNNVRTFTVGFNLNIEDSNSNRRAVEFLKALAFVGNGGDLSDPDGVDGVTYGADFYTANTASELEEVFETIVQEIIQETTSFVAPGISINAVNRLYHLNDIYYSLFRPDDTVGWLGNLKKFELCEAGQSGCEFGEVIDKNGVPAVHTNPDNPDTFGTLKADAQGVWSSPSDSAPEINQGGAGEQIPSYTQRNVYVNTSDASITPPATPPTESTDTKGQGTDLTRIDLASHVGDSPASTADFNEVKAALYAENNCNGPSDIADKDECLDELIEWMTGKKFPGDVPRDGSDDDDERWAFGDPMHSRPLILTYGIYDGGTDTPDDDVPLSKVFVGTNDGGLRMLNDGDGVEEWIYHPYSKLGMQSTLKLNLNGVHEYGIDGTPTVRINDEDDDFIVDPADGDFVHLYIGMRRGGKELIALNVTPESTVGRDTSITGAVVGQKGLVTPEILWRISPNDDSDFQRLGDTWSTPRPARIQSNDGSKTVLIFGGGYSTEQDGIDGDGTPPDDGDSYNSSTSGDNEGNAIYIVDADTGERLWWASSDSNADFVISDMNTAIAAPVTLVDSNQDSHVDRIYAVDLRGQVFRVDIDAKPEADLSPGESELADSSVGVLATLGPDEGAIPAGEQAPNEDRRKFFYAPEVARVNDTAVVEEPYDLIGIISGNRSNPQAKTVLDRTYAIRDFLIDNPAGGLNSSNFPKCNPRPGASNCPTTAITHNHLSDVTEKDSFVIREEQPDGTLTLTDPDGNDPPASALNDLQDSHGWYFDLQGELFDAVTPPSDITTGEKGFSTATVLDGKMFFTTYLPPEDAAAVEDACSVAGTLGTSRFYAVDFFTGAPAFDRNTDATFDKAERFKNIGAGPSSDVTVVNQPGNTLLQVPTRQGSKAENPGFAPEFNKTFWVEER